MTSFNNSKKIAQAKIILRSLENEKHPLCQYQHHLKVAQNIARLFQQIQKRRLNIYYTMHVIAEKLWRSIVVRPPVQAGELYLSCARLTAGHVTTLLVKRPLSVNQHGHWPTQPAIPRGSVKWVVIHLWRITAVSCCLCRWSGRCTEPVYAGCGR